MYTGGGRRGTAATAALPPSANLSKAKNPASPTPTSLLRPVQQWQAHETMVTSVKGVNYRAKFDLLVTAGIDSYVHLWTVDGAHIGTFGQVRLFRSQKKAEKTHARAASSVLFLSTTVMSEVFTIYFRRD